MAVLALIVIIVLDGVVGGKLYITNDTDKDITDIIVAFQDYDGNLMDNLFEGSIKAGESLDFKYGSDIIYNDVTYECVVYVTFDGENELVISDGTFENNFGGNIRLNFHQKDDEYYLHMKGGLGLFETTGSTDMNTEMILYFEDNDWDYVM